MRLTEAIETLLVATKANGQSPRTVQAYREKLGYLVGFMGADKPVESITVDDLRRYVASLWDVSTRWAEHPAHQESVGGLSPFTVASRVRTMKRLFNFLEAEGIIANNPARRIKAPQPKRDKPKGIQWDDFLALLKTTEGGELRDVRDRAVILFLFDTGCRVGGLCGLRVSDLDLERRRALVMEKRDKPRLVFFKPETARALAAWLEVRPQDKGLWLFVGLSPRAKPQLTIAAVEKMLKRRGEQVGISGPVNPHAFRHGFASHYLMSGGDLASLSEILGHSDVAVTKGFYGVFTADDLQVKHEQHSPISGLGGDTNGS